MGLKIQREYQKHKKGVQWIKSVVYHNLVIICIVLFLSRKSSKNGIYTVEMCT